MIQKRPPLSFSRYHESFFKTFVSPNGLFSVLVNLSEEEAFYALFFGTLFLDCWISQKISRKQPFEANKRLPLFDSQEGHRLVSSNNKKREPIGVKHSQNNTVECYF